MKCRFMFCALALLVLVVPRLVSGQTLQLNARTAANPNSASQNIVEYRFYLDALPAVTLPATLDPSCSCVSRDFSVTTTGPHTVKFTAVNLDPLGNKVEGQPLTATVTIATLVFVQPGVPTGPITFTVK